MQHLINALLIGGIYAAIGMGFSLIYGVMNIINLSHGSIVLMGGYVTYYITQKAGIDPLLAIPLVMGIWFVLGFLQQKYILNRVMMGSGTLPIILLTFGFDLILITVAQVVWGANFRSVNTSYAIANFSIGTVTISNIRLIVFLAGIALASSLYLIITKTKIGKAIQATSLNRDAARLVGIDIKHIWCMTYAIASAYAAAAGALIIMIYSINPSGAHLYLGKAFTIAVLGGLGNMAGAIIGGPVLALAEVYGSVLLGPSFQLFVSSVIFLLVIIFRPHGLVGKKFYGDFK